MKIFFQLKKSILLLTLFIIAATGSFAGPPHKKQHQSKVLRVLIIGNSFSQNPTTFLPQLVKEGGFQLQLGHAELGGCSLERHWNIAALAEANPDDPKGKAYNGRSLPQLLSDGKWDVVTMQQYSKLSADINTYQPFAGNLYKLIKKTQPGAKVVWQQTWAYRRDAINFGLINATEAAKNDQQMYEKLYANYHKMAEELHAGLIPTGAAFWKMRNDPVWGFVPDSKAVIDACVFPVLPPQLHSINMGYTWDKNKKLTFDPNHANVAGQYLGALIWYHYLFGADLSKVKFKPYAIDEDFAKQLRATAIAVFAENLAVYN